MVIINKKLLISALLALMLSGTQSFAMVPEANALYQQACSAEYKADYTTAVEKLLQALNLSGNDVMIYTKLAGVYSEMGEYEKALEAYSRVIELKPSDGYVYLSIGSIYENQGKYKEALDAYKKVAEMCPDYLYNYLNIGNVQYQLSDYNAAIEAYNKFLSTYSQHWDARENLAASYLNSENFEKAVNEYESLFTRNPNGFNQFSNYGLALFRISNYQKASEMLEKAVSIDPENTLAHVNLALSYQELKKNDLALAQYDIVFRQQPALNGIRFDYGNLLADMDQEEAAIENYKIYIKNYPDDFRAYQNIGVVYKRLNQIDDAIISYEKALDLQKDKKDINLEKDLAECYHLKKDYQNAIKYYDDVLLVENDNYDIKLDKAKALHAMENYKDAIVLYKELLKEKENADIKENLVSALVAQGDSYLKAQNFALAVDTFNNALEFGCKNSYAYFALAQSYRGASMNEKASEYYQKAISMDPTKTQYSKEFASFIAATNQVAPLNNFTNNDSSEIEEIKISMDSNKDAQINPEEQKKNLITTGDENYKKKSYDDAIFNYQEALKLNPADEVTLLKIGNIYKIKNDNKNAISFYKKAIVVNPNYTDGWFNLGLVYANEKNNSKAKESFYRVISLNPNYGYAYYALALAYEQDGNKKEALNNYKIFLTHNKDEAIAKSVQQKIKNLEQ